MNSYDHFIYDFIWFMNSYMNLGVYRSLFQMSFIADKHAGAASDVTDVHHHALERPPTSESGPLSHRDSDWHAARGIHAQASRFKLDFMTPMMTA